MLANYISILGYKKAIILNLAPWRVLGIDKCGALTRAALVYAKHTPKKKTTRTTRKTE